ncbi:ABC transporter permease [Streptomyces sp. NPDC057307]|uniref:ABC transporter permease n=1 Tax=Streptomyces sp. NPDC057307 TaxID=3346096 RepID=UPI00363A5823
MSTSSATAATPGAAAGGAATPPPTSSWAVTLRAVVIVTLFLAGILVAFALPQIHLGPRDIPIAVVGEPAAADALGTRLEKERPGAFDITQVSDTQEARRLIDDHEVYGAVVTHDAEDPSMIIASQAGLPVANVLKELGSQLRGGVPPGAVEDVKPLPADDPTGAGLSSGSLPMVLGGWLAAVLILMQVRGLGRQVSGVFLFSVIGGFVLSAMIKYVFGSVDDGNLFLMTAAAALSLAATAWMILGLRAAFGNPGLGVGGLLVILIGNPLSGLSSAPEMLPDGWSTLGQLLPPGAGGTLLRSVAYFEGNGALVPVLVLTSWMAGGVVLFLFGMARARKKALASSQAASTGGPQNAAVPAS